MVERRLLVLLRFMMTITRLLSMMMSIVARMMILPPPSPPPPMRSWFVIEVDSRCRHRLLCLSSSTSNFICFFCSLSSWVWGQGCRFWFEDGEQQLITTRA